MQASGAAQGGIEANQMRFAARRREGRLRSPKARSERAAQRRRAKWPWPFDTASSPRR